MKRENDPSAPSNALFNWYPGHMAKALREIKQRLNMVDVVLEIRDARAPLATENVSLEQELGQKKRIIVFNKANLADPEGMKAWSAYFTKRGTPFLFVNGLNKGALKDVVTLAKKISPGNAPNAKLRLMIVGLPNTGKSTIINQLSNKSNAKVADRPGQTVLQQWIDTDHGIKLLDTPGVMPPHVLNPQQALWLSAIHAIPDDIASVEETALFLVQHLLSRTGKEFLARFKLESSTLPVDEVLLKIAALRGCLKQKGEADLDRVHKLILLEFRQGELGRVCFGTPPKF